ncbi:hypothetical protein AB6805_14820 [Chitinophaga sp. RCC_12]|uniref:hypothetical protein n=1 Tax=Chitinophaga sp. RCC_12 TaxID=3239226 RepID=UPI0035248AB9
MEEKPSLLKQFIDAIGLPKLMQKHSDNVEEEAEFQQVQALKHSGLQQVTSNLKDLHDAQGMAISFVPGGSTLFSMLDYGIGIDKNPSNVLKVGGTDLAFAFGGSLFGKVGKVGGSLQDKFISNFNKTAKRFGISWGALHQNGKFTISYLEDWQIIH